MVLQGLDGSLPRMVFPRGSILGPLLYIIYTSGLSTLLAETGAKGQLYADDIQAYIHCRPSNASLVVGEMVLVLHGQVGDMRFMLALKSG